MGSDFGGLGDGVGDYPCCAADGDADGVACPVEVIARSGAEIWDPEEELEDQDFDGEQARGERRQDAGEDGDSGREKA